MINESFRSSSCLYHCRLGTPAQRPRPGAFIWYAYQITKSLSEFPTWLQDLCNAETQKSHLN